MKNFQILAFLFCIQITYAQWTTDYSQNTPITADLKEKIKLLNEKYNQTIYPMDFLDK